MKNYKVYSLIFIAVLLYGKIGLAREKIIITGSSTIAPVMSDLAKLFEENHPQIRIDVQTGGSSRGVLDVRNETSNLGMVSRTLKKSELDLIPFTFAKDGIVIITHKLNQVNLLNEEQIRKIFTGEIKNWKEVGGENSRITVVNKAEGRSTLELFLKFFNLKNSQIKASIIIGDNEQGIKAISINKSAIGYVSIGAAEYNSSIGTPIKLLPYKGVIANVQNVKNGSYPLIRRLNVITKQRPMGTIKKFLEYIQTTAAHKTIKSHFFVPVQ